MVNDCEKWFLVTVFPNYGCCCVDTPSCYHVLAVKRNANKNLNTSKHSLRPLYLVVLLALLKILQVILKRNTKKTLFLQEFFDDDALYTVRALIGNKEKFSACNICTLMSCSLCEKLYRGSCDKVTTYLKKRPKNCKCSLSINKHAIITNDVQK